MPIITLTYYYTYFCNCNVVQFWKPFFDAHFNLMKWRRNHRIDGCWCFCWCLICWKISAILDICIVRSPFHNNLPLCAYVHPFLRLLPSVNPLIHLFIDSIWSNFNLGMTKTVKNCAEFFWSVIVTCVNIKLKLCQSNGKLFSSIIVII